MSEAKKDLWNSILAQAQAQAPVLALRPARVVVLGLCGCLSDKSDHFFKSPAITANNRLNLFNSGDSGSGKSTVVARLKGEKLAADQAGLGTGVEYSFIDVRDEDSEGLNDMCATCADVHLIIIVRDRNTCWCILA